MSWKARSVCQSVEPTGSSDNSESRQRPISPLYSSDNWLSLVYFIRFS